MGRSPIAMKNVKILKWTPQQNKRLREDSGSGRKIVLRLGTKLLKGGRDKAKWKNIVKEANSHKRKKVTSRYCA